MIVIIGLLTAAMILNCLVLILLVLMQLPKKDAGAGLAFGGAATDALFGAGSGNFLTKATKYSAGIFFVLAVILSVIQTQRAHSPGSDFQKMLQTEAEQRPAAPIETGTPAPGAKPPTAPPPA